MLCFDCGAGAQVGVFSGLDNADSLDALQQLQIVDRLFLDILYEDSFLSPTLHKECHEKSIKRCLMLLGGLIAASLN